MSEMTDTKHLDKRVVARYIRKGTLDDKEFERHLKALPDLEEQAIPVESEFEDNFIDED
jgi:hypothetical protein